jgi:hypothetical protein
MTYRTVLLTLHITGAGAWLGANFVQAVLSPRFAKGPADVAAAWTRQIIWLGERYYSVVGALIAITGVLLVIETPWSFGDGFVMLGITTVAIGAALGILFFGPMAKRRAEALESGDLPTADEAQRRIIPAAVFDTALVLLTILTMVHKWAA